MKNLRKNLVYVSMFAIAMGFLESSVVIYLRELYYPNGFAFPLKIMPLKISIVELLREAATIFMLIAVGYLSGKTKLQRFAYFSYAFAIWDIFYYVFLYVFLGWPQSLFTWDILFLLPAPWVGPVWAPCLLSALMIFGSVFVLHRSVRDKNYTVGKKQWIILISGAVICILAFMWDYLISHGGISVFRSGEKITDDIKGYVPESFNISMFMPGLLLMTFAVLNTIYKSSKIKT